MKSLLRCPNRFKLLFKHISPSVSAPDGIMGIRFMKFPQELTERPITHL